MENKAEACPSLFRDLTDMGILGEQVFAVTRDGFYLAKLSLAELLACRGIDALVGSKGQCMPCSAYFDDWHLYGVRKRSGCVYSLVKLREQEYDAARGDGDTPGVTVSFIAFQTQLLEQCLKQDSQENRKLLCAEIDRVVAARGQIHDPDLKDYFLRPEAQAPYLIAEQYVLHLASCARDGILPLPEACRALLENRGGNCRIPDFLEANNQSAGRIICDGQRLYLGSAAGLSVFEKLALLASHTGNTSFHSFAAEIRWHAMFLMGIARIRLPFLGGSVYGSAIRADMTIDDKEFEGPTPYYDLESRLVQEQKKWHPEFE